MHYKCVPGRDRADALAAVLEEDRLGVLVAAPREYLQYTTHDDIFTRNIVTTYY